ncbi:MAG: RNA-binding protein [Deltaproteobacteria bacterium]|nr:RNA-binding protein [Deltaproteobacteria bacterium]
MKIYVGNMPFSMNEGQLRSLFEGFGEVDSVNVITDRETGRPRGFAFVEMNDDESAQKAITELAEHEVEGRRLNVNKARPREDRGRGGGGGGRGGGRGGGGGGGGGGYNRW